jgi:hypothetical protein
LTGIGELYAAEVLGEGLAFPEGTCGSPRSALAMRGVAELSYVPARNLSTSMES